MAVTVRKTGYPLFEVFEVTSEGTTPVRVLEIPAGTIIEKLWVRIKVPCTGDANNLTVGDGATADGFILASDAKGSVGTIYGDNLVIGTEKVGAFLVDAIVSTPDHKQTKPIGKIYTAAGSWVKFVLSAAGTLQGVYEVFIVGKRWDV